MFEDIITKADSLIYLILVILYLLFIKYAARKAAERRMLTDEEYIAKMARLRGRSEHDIFCIAAQEWHVSEKKADRDFKTYLKYNELPYYVKDYIRKSRMSEMQRSEYSDKNQ
jgi:hypothetical protein